MRDTLAPPDPDALSSLPMFPLPNCVLLPGGLLPLHVFEPRYRELTRDCLAGHQFMGIARLRPGFETTYYGRPPVYERFGVGNDVGHYWDTHVGVARGRGRVDWVGFNNCIHNASLRTAHRR